MSNFLAGACFVMSLWCAEDRDYKHAVAFLLLAVGLCVEAVCS